MSNKPPVFPGALPFPFPSQMSDSSVAVSSAKRKRDEADAAADSRPTLSCSSCGTTTTTAWWTIDDQPPLCRNCSTQQRVLTNLSKRHSSDARPGPVNTLSPADHASKKRKTSATVQALQPPVSTRADASTVSGDGFHTPHRSGPILPTTFPLHYSDVRTAPDASVEGRAVLTEANTRAVVPEVLEARPNILSATLPQTLARSRSEPSDTSSPTASLSRLSLTTDQRHPSEALSMTSEEPATRDSPPAGKQDAGGVLLSGLRRMFDPPVHVTMPGTTLDADQEEADYAYSSDAMSDWTHAQTSRKQAPRRRRGETCDDCRKAKVRCDSDRAAGINCLLCRRRGNVCKWSAKPGKRKRDGPPTQTLSSDPRVPPAERIAVPSDHAPSVLLPLSNAGAGGSRKDADHATSMVEDSGAPSSNTSSHVGDADRPPIRSKPPSETIAQATVHHEALGRTVVVPAVPPVPSVPPVVTHRSRTPSVMLPWAASTRPRTSDYKSLPTSNDAGPTAPTVSGHIERITTDSVPDQSLAADGPQESSQHNNVADSLGVSTSPTQECNSKQLGEAPIVRADTPPELVDGTSLEPETAVLRKLVKRHEERGAANAALIAALRQERDEMERRLRRDHVTFNLQLAAASKKARDAAQQADDARVRAASGPPVQPNALGLESTQAHPEANTPSDLNEELLTTRAALQAATEELSSLRAQLAAPKSAGSPDNVDPKSSRKTHQPEITHAQRMSIPEFVERMHELERLADRLYRRRLRSQQQTSSDSTS